MSFERAETTGRYGETPALSAMNKPPCPASPAALVLLTSGHVTDEDPIDLPMAQKIETSVDSQSPKSIMKIHF
jgi:hypothetical protein